MNILVSLLLLSSMALVGCQEKKLQPKTDDEKSFYTIGLMSGSSIKGIETSKQEREMAIQGFKDAIRGEKHQVEMEKERNKIGALFRKRSKSMSIKLKEKGKMALEKFIKEGAMKTESGIAYKVLKEGTGKMPNADSRVKVHYHGTLLDGTVFDSSVKRGQPVTFSLKGVIKCWTEGMQKIKQGGKIKLMCPAELAYGDRGAPPRIPGGSTLVFEVELLEILAPVTESKPTSSSKKPKKKK